MTGGSFTPVTVTIKDVLVADEPSLALMVTVVKPFWSASGLMTRERLVPVPSRRRFASGMREAFEECALSERLLAGVSTSEIVKETARVPSSANDWSGMF